MKKKYVFLVCISVISFLLSLIAIEISFRIYTKKYFTNKIERKSSYQAPFYSMLYDEIYETNTSYTNQNDEIKIYALGDSYTNGGNVIRRKTYPRRLFEMLDQKYDVINMGMCEDTSEGALQRLKLELSENEKVKPVVVVLIGAADVFLNFKKYKEELTNFYKKISKEEIYSKFKLNSFNLKSIDFVKYSINNLREKYRYINMPKEYFTEEYVKCNKLKSDTACLLEMFDRHKLEIISDRTIFNQYLTFVIYTQRMKHRETPEFVVEVLIDVLKKDPNILKYPEYVYNLITFSSMQIKIPFKKIVEIIKAEKVKATNLEDIVKKEESDHIGNVIDFMNSWVDGNDLIRNERVENYRKIIAFVRSMNGEVILLNYPLDYKDTNEDIERVAKEEGVPFVNLKETFKNHEHDKHLISDWEHCTEYGYKLMAKEVVKEIRVVLDKK